MLIDDDRILETDDILSMISMANGNDPTTKKLRSGMYQMGAFTLPFSISGEYETFLEFDPAFSDYSSYGVCDNFEQVLEQCPWVITSPREFIIVFTPIHKKNQPAKGGWRWHKWGEYIGTQNKQCEYLYNEKDIEKVYVYHIYMKK